MEQLKSGHMARNIEMFRGIAEHFSDWEKPQKP